MTPLQQLIVDLRSGEFKQSFEQLAWRDSKGQLHCCPWGLVALRAAPLGYLEQKEYEGDISFNGSLLSVPLGAINYLGIGTTHKFQTPKGPASLLSMNDRLKLSFTEIADIIESSLTRTKPGCPGDNGAFGS